jgi:ERCC4-type nuclease
MKVKFIKNPTFLGYAYAEGQTANVGEKEANELIHDGLAVQVETSTLPSDLPGREALEAAGLDEIETVKELDADFLQSIEGIGKATLEKIVKYFE